MPIMALSGLDYTFLLKLFLKSIVLTNHKSLFGILFTDKKKICKTPEKIS